MDWVKSGKIQYWLTVLFGELLGPMPMWDFPSLFFVIVAYCFLFISGPSPHYRRRRNNNKWKPLFPPCSCLLSHTSLNKASRQRRNRGLRCHQWIVAASSCRNLFFSWTVTWLAPSILLRGFLVSLVPMWGFQIFWISVPRFPSHTMAVDHGFWELKSRTCIEGQRLRTTSLLQSLVFLWFPSFTQAVSNGVLGRRIWVDFPLVCVLRVSGFMLVIVTLLQFSRWVRYLKNGFTRDTSPHWVFLGRVWIQTQLSWILVHQSIYNST